MVFIGYIKGASEPPSRQRHTRKPEPTQANGRRPLLFNTQDKKMNNKKSITVVINITSQNTTLTIPNYTTLSKLDICEAVIFTSGTSKTGKERASAAILEDCFFRFTGFNNAILHEICGSYFTPNTDRKTNEFILSKADIQDATITINTAETVTNKVIEITFFYTE